MVAHRQPQEPSLHRREAEAVRSRMLPYGQPHLHFGSAIATCVLSLSDHTAQGGIETTVGPGFSHFGYAARFKDSKLSESLEGR
jgi:hypothetical protein